MTTTTPPTLSSVNQFSPLVIQPFERYLPSAFNDSLTMLQKMNKIINSLNLLGDNFNTVVDQWNSAITWVEGDGLTTAVDNLLNQWYTDGTLNTIINIGIIGQLSDLTTTDKTSLVNAINELELDINNAKVKVNNIHVDVMNDFGAKGDGITDDTTAIQNAINSLPNGGIVYFPLATFKFTEVDIQNPYITLTGPGTLAGVVHLNPLVGKQMYTKIEGLRFVSTGTFGIRIVNSGKVDIKDCYFEGQDKAIYFDPLDASEHSSRIQIQGNRFYNNNYALYSDAPTNYTNTFLVADINFSGNIVEPSKISNVYMLAVDGFTCENNTFFFPGKDTQNTTKQNNIYIDKANWVIIANNNLFEAGLEAILLSRVQNANVTGNNIAWCGQRQPSSAIRFINGDYNGQSYNLSQINGNTMMYPSLHGISIEGICGNIGITGNEIWYAGSVGSYYYGATDLTTISHYGVYSDATVTGLNVTGNTMPQNQMKIQSPNGTGSNFDNNLEKSNVVQKRHNVGTVTGVVADGSINGFDTTGYEQINVNLTSATSISELKGGFEGKTVTLVTFNGNLTLNHNDPTAQGTNTQLWLKGATNVTLANNSVIQFLYTTNKWYEISRNF